MEKVIQKAIEGGYEPFFSSKFSNLKVEELFLAGDEFSVSVGEGMPYKRNVSSIFLDPLFWQSLSSYKALGWDEIDAQNKSDMPSWIFYWHRFIDHLAQGGTPTDFFNNLLGE